MQSEAISIDEFQALEQKVLLTVELIKKEREARSTAESERGVAEAQLEAARLELESARAKASAAQQEIDALKQELAKAREAQAEVASLLTEREAVRQRVEKMLATMDELL